MPLNGTILIDTLLADGSVNHTVVNAPEGDDTVTGTGFAITVLGGGGDDMLNMSFGIGTVSGGTVNAFSELIITNNGGDALVSWAGGSAELTGIDHAKLTEADFDFVKKTIAQCTLGKTDGVTGKCSLCLVGKIPSNEGNICPKATVFGPHHPILGCTAP